MAAHEIAAFGVAVLIIAAGRALRWPVRFAAGAVAGELVEVAVHLTGIA
jgi:hypothetical protein